MRGSIKAILFNLSLLSLLFPFHPSTAAAASAVQSLREQAHVAVDFSASRTREAAVYISGISSGSNGKSPRSLGPSPFNDCAGMMAHSAERLEQSREEMKILGRAGSPEYRLHAGNVKTWVSSALTDQDMCLGSLSTVASSKLMEVVKAKVTSVRQATSNALSLVNKMN